MVGCRDGDRVLQRAVSVRGEKVARQGGPLQGLVRVLGPHTVPTEVATCPGYVSYVGLRSYSIVEPAYLDLGEGLLGCGRVEALILQDGHDHGKA